jgi:hypothetical protein
MNHGDPGHLIMFIHYSFHLFLVHLPLESLQFSGTTELSSVFTIPHICSIQCEM